MPRKFFRLATAAALLSIGFGAQAQDAAPIRLELNKLEQVAASCRTHLVILNRSDEAYSAYKVDLVFFDRKAIVKQRIALDLAPLRPKKTTVLNFDVPDVECASLSKVLLNDVTACQTDTSAKKDCVALVETASRADVAFGK